MSSVPRTHLFPYFFGISCLICAACRREERSFSEPPSASRLHATPESVASDEESLKRYAKDAWAMSEGQRLFAQMNCAGCHGKGGGGGMGPPLMDSYWIYGNGLEDIERIILAGSARGMPSFKDKLSPQQVWELVAYVRSLSGQAPSTAAPVRDDHMSVRPPPSRTDPEPPQKQVD